MIKDELLINNMASPRRNDNGLAGYLNSLRIRRQLTNFPKKSQ